MDRRGAEIAEFFMIFGSLGIGVVKTFRYTDFTENTEKARIFLGFLRESPCNPCTNHGESQRA